MAEEGELSSPDELETSKLIVLLPQTKEYKLDGIPRFDAKIEHEFIQCFAPASVCIQIILSLFIEF